MNDVIFTQHLISIQISCQKFQTKPGFSLPIFLNSVGYISREFFRRFFYSAVVLIWWRATSKGKLSHSKKKKYRVFHIQKPCPLKITDLRLLKNVVNSTHNVGYTWLPVSILKVQLQKLDFMECIIFWWICFSKQLYFQRWPFFVMPIYTNSTTTSVVLILKPAFHHKSYCIQLPDWKL